MVFACEEGCQNHLVAVAGANLPIVDFGQVPLGYEMRQSYMCGIHKPSSMYVCKEFMQ